MTEITLTDVQVDIPIYGVRGSNLKGTLLRGLRKNGRPETKWVRALDNVNLHLKDGDRLGLIGPNGAGKTTLLRVLGGILSPTSGSLRVVGGVASMFEVGLGMSADATGRDNIIIRGMMQGFTREEAESRQDAIVEFAGLGERIDYPLRTYSAGMVARLTFAIATAVEPEVLLLDEGIGTADAAFTAKARARLDEFMRSARILVLASHSEQTLQEFCDQVLVLDQGQVTYHGPVEGGLKVYRSRLMQSTSGEGP